MTKGIDYEIIDITTQMVPAWKGRFLVTIPSLSLYPILFTLISALFGSGHLASLRSISQLVWSLLLCQSLHPADLARALPELQTGRARQALKRVRRIIERCQLTSSYLSPLLIRAALLLVTDKEVMLVIDSTYCIHWEIFTMGIQFRGRVLPVSWSILPYPMPKHSFTPTVIALVKATLSSWPEDRPVHLLADRYFPSVKLFKELANWQKSKPLGYTIRLKAGDWVRLEDGRTSKVKNLVGNVTPGTWFTYRASYQHRFGPGPLASLHIGRGVPVYPRHQMGPADVARREKRANRRKVLILSNVSNKERTQMIRTDTIWVLLSTADSCPAAIGAYARRFSTEGTYRDLKRWGLEKVAGFEKSIKHLEGLVGLAFMGYIIQAAIGMEAGRAQEKGVRARQQQWSTTDRLSIFWRGRQVLHDHGYDWSAWVNETLQGLTNKIAFNDLNADPGHGSRYKRSRLMEVA